MKTCGIYRITNIINNKCYIGLSINCNKRLSEHKRDLKSNNYKHENKYFIDSYNKYGKDAFKFEIIFLCNPQDLATSEIYFINAFKSNNKEFGYNLTIGGEGTSGYKPTLEQKINRSINYKNNEKIINQCLKMAKNNIGRKQSVEHNNKIGLSKISKKRKPFTKEHKLNMGLALKGRKQSPEHIIKRFASRRKDKEI